MKRILVFILSIMLMLSLVACGKEEKSQSSSQVESERSSVTQLGEDKLLQQSVEYAENLAKGDFDSIRNSFSESTKKQVSVKKLRDAWIDTVKDFGEYQSIHSSSCEMNNNTADLIVILKYEKDFLELSLRYNIKNNIDGIWIKPAIIEPVNEQNENFEAKPIKIGKEPFVLDGMLTMPKKDVQPVVVILVHGSGQSDLNEKIGENKPFEDIAYGLAKKGIPTLRYNKRYFQYANLAKPDITVNDDVLDDVTNAIQFVQQNENLKNSKIIVLGHSLGGMLAPKIASDNNDVAGIISLAGSPRKIEDIILDQNKSTINSMQDKSDIEKKKMIEQVEAEIKKIKEINPSDKPSTIMGIHSNYWNSLNQINSAELAKGLDIPMLFMQGSADFQVLTDVDYKQWQEILKDKTNAEFKLYDNLNHLFMTSKGKKDISDYDGKGMVEPKVIDDIANWIKEKI